MPALLFSVITRLGKFHEKLGVWGALSTPQTPVLPCEFENFAKSWGYMDGD